MTEKKPGKKIGNLSGGRSDIAQDGKRQSFQKSDQAGKISSFDKPIPPAKPKKG